MRLARGTLADEEVAAFQNKTFVNVQFHSDKFKAEVDSWAIDLIPTTLVITPDGDTLWRHVGEIGANDYLEALHGAIGESEKLAALKARIAESPRNPGAHEALGAWFAARHDTARAAQSYRKAIPLIGTKTGADRRRVGEMWVVVAAADVGDGASADQVERHADRLESLDPKQTLGLADNILFLRAVANFIRGDTDALFDQMTTLREDYPDSDKDAEAMVWIGHVLYDRKDYKAAKKIYLEFVDLYPDSPHVDPVAYRLRKRLRNVKVED